MKMCGTSKVRSYLFVGLVLCCWRDAYSFEKMITYEIRQVITKIPAIYRLDPGTNTSSVHSYHLLDGPSKVETTVSVAYNKSKIFQQLSQTLSENSLDRFEQIDLLKDNNQVQVIFFNPTVTPRKNHTPSMLRWSAPEVKKSHGENQVYPYQGTAPSKFSPFFIPKPLTPWEVFESGKEFQVYLTQEGKEEYLKSMLFLSLKRLNSLYLELVEKALSQGAEVSLLKEGEVRFETFWDGHSTGNLLEVVLRGNQEELKLMTSPVRLTFTFEVVYPDHSKLEL